MSVPTHESEVIACLSRQPWTVPEALAQHWRVTRFHGSETKNGHEQLIDAAKLARFPFWRPPVTPNLCAIFVDLDHLDAVDHLFGAVVLPHIVTETPRGAHGMWLLDRVHTGKKAKPEPLAYAEAVGPALRAALGGDLSVDPLRPGRVRNPGYNSRDVMPTGLPLSRPWRLGEIHAALEDAGQWPARSTSIRSTVARSGVFVGRNDAVNRATWLTVRHALEDGTRERWSEAEVLAVAQRVNREIAGTEGVDPLPEQEVRHLATSITRHQHRPGRRGVGGSEAARELGAKGGAVRSEAKTASGRINAANATAIWSAEASARAGKIRLLAEQGLTRAQIIRELGCSESTVKRALRNR
jgi:hypothetical protein